MIILIKDKDDNCHQVEALLIAVYSRLIRNILKYNPSDTVIRLPTIDADILSFIITWVKQPQSLPLQLNNVEKCFVCDLLVTSEFLDMAVLSQSIISWLAEQLNLENVLELWIFTRDFIIIELESLCWKYLMNNFQEINPRYFNSLGPRDLISVLKSDELMLKEEEVWKIVQKLTDGREEDSSSFQIIEDCVRWGLIGERFWRNEVLPSPQYKSYLRKPRTPKHIHELHIRGTRPRNPRDLLFLFGGEESAVMDANSGRLASLPVSAPATFDLAGAVPGEHEIYIVGGRLAGAASRSLFKVNLKDWSLTIMSSMMEGREKVGVAYVDNYIYAVGGQSEGRSLESVERYNITNNQWEEAGEMWTARAEAGVAALNGKIYVMGGFDGSKVLSSVEVFNPKCSTEAQWKKIPSMIKKRRGLKVAVWRGKLYVVGGFGRNKSRRCGEVFDPAKGRWNKLPKLNERRTDFHLLVADGQLLVLGGDKDTVEVFDEKRKKWELKRQRFLASKCSASCSTPTVKTEVSQVWRKLNFES